MNRNTIMSPGFVIKACRHRSVEDMERLFEHHPIDCRDSYNNTPLHEASCWGREDLVRFLLSRGADRSATDQYGKTPLDWAERRGHKAVADLLRHEASKSS